MTEYSSMDYWFSYVFGNKEEEIVEKMYKALSLEVPRILSVVGERNCNLQCQHCIFQKEKSSEDISSVNGLIVAVQAIAKQMESNSIIVHEGRIFRPSHLKWLWAIRKIRPDIKIGIIDNGSYLRNIDQIESSGFKFDWIDISVDGSAVVHNRQRNSKTSFVQALAGIKNAYRILSADGEVNSLFTLTQINHASILETCSILPDEISQWHITTLTPARSEIKRLSLTDDEFFVSWDQICQANLKRPIFFRSYVANDLLKIAKATGKVNFLRAFQNAKVDFSSISFEIDGIQVIYYPQSVSTAETFVLDANAHYHVPYSIAYTLEELTKGISRHGENLEKYIIGKVNASSSLKSLYKKGVVQWKNNFAKEALQRESLIFSKIQKL